MPGHGIDLLRIFHSPDAAIIFAGCTCKDLLLSWAPLQRGSLHRKTSADPAQALVLSRYHLKYDLSPIGYVLEVKLPRIVPYSTSLATQKWA